MFKSGEKVVCINNKKYTKLKKYNVYTIRALFSYKKTYFVILEGYNVTSPMDFLLEPENFISLKEYRKKKLKKIINDSYNKY